MILTSVLKPLSYVFPIENPIWFWLLPVVILFLFFVIRKDFVRQELDNIERRRRRRARFWFFISRSIISLLVIIALTTPYIEVSKETAGNPQITLLVDDSNSMKVMDLSFLDSFKKSLGEKVPLTVRSIGSGTSSALGDAILDNLEPDSQVLLVSDGNTISGSSLDDVAFFAANSLNATISALQLASSHNDYSVYILGPGKVVAGTSNKFSVHISATDDKPVYLKVLIDGLVVYDQETADRVLAFDKELSVGVHRIEAHLLVDDYFSQNNDFYKTVNVIEKPKVLLLSAKSSPLESVLNDLYSVTKVSSLPSDLSPYYAIIANDVGADKLRNVNQLHEFLIDEAGGYYGGGLVVVGGFNSFDRGGYHNAPIESLLPVSVGRGEQKKGNDNIVIVIDISGSTTGVRYEKRCDANGNCRFVEVNDKVSALDIIKAQAVNLISSEKNILASNKVGVVVFGAQGIVSEEDRLAGKHYEASDTVKIVEPLDYLYNNQGRLKEKIPRLKGGGPSEIGLALSTAYQMLKPGQNNYILLLTDGNIAPAVQKQALGVVSQLNKKGVKVFVYGVGRSKDNVKSDFLTALARAGDGLYEGPVFTSSSVNPARISIKWGDPDKKSFGDQFGLIIFSLTHFITRDLELNAVLNGFNQVTPKSTSKVLVTTDFGQPALTVWNYGNGRVAALTVFTGGGLGELLNADNSRFITRIVNWAIGDPQRKQKFAVDISDARINQSASVIVISDKPLSVDGVDFVKEGNSYKSSITPHSLGFNQFLGETYAVNYDKEYQFVGFSDEINRTVEMTNGKLFSPEDIDGIVDFATEMSHRVDVERQPLRWPFICAALVIFLLEVFLRRISQYRDNR